MKAGTHWLPVVRRITNADRLDAMADRLFRIELMLRRNDVMMRLLLSGERVIMATLDEDLALVSANGDRLDSLQTYIEGLNTRLMDALSGANLSPEVQAKVDAVFAGETANAGKIDKALNTGVPAPTP